MEHIIHIYLYTINIYIYWISFSPYHVPLVPFVPHLKAKWSICPTPRVLWRIRSHHRGSGEPGQSCLHQWLACRIRIGRVSFFFVRVCAICFRKSILGRYFIVNRSLEYWFRSMYKFRYRLNSCSMSLYVFYFAKGWICIYPLACRATLQYPKGGNTTLGCCWSSSCRTAQGTYFTKIWYKSLWGTQLIFHTKTIGQHVHLKPVSSHGFLFW